jgi:hypothetical protein
MRKWILWIGIVAALFVGGYFVLSFFAVKVIQSQIQKVVGPGFTIAEIKVKPTYLSVRGIQYEGLHTRKRYLQIEELRVYPAVLSFLKGPLRIREFMVLQPSFFFSRTREGVFVGPWTGMEKGEKKKEVSGEKESKEKEPIVIRIDRFRIRKGSLEFEDGKTGEPPAQIKMRDFYLDIKEVQFPIISAHSPIEFKGKMMGKTKEGDIYTKGWIDFKSMDMETSFKAREIDVKTFEPYYRKRVSAEIDSGYIHMDAKIAVKKKMIDAPVQLELDDLYIKKGEGTVFWIPAETLASLLEDRKHRIQVPFQVKGNLDDPKFSLQEAFLTRMGISLAEALGIPIKSVGEELLGGSIKGDKGLAEELKSIEELLKKKKEKTK